MQFKGPANDFGVLKARGPFLLSLSPKIANTSSLFLES